MILLIILKSKKIRLRLKQQGKTIAYCEWKEDRDISQTLLPKISLFMKKNSFSFYHLSEIVFQNFSPSSFTANCIVKTTVNSLNFGLKRILKIDKKRAVMV